MAREYDFDAVIVGAGAVGLACAFALARAGAAVVVLERERVIGSGVSSRNSEVMHAGLYYPTGSNRAALCVSGRRRLHRFLIEHGVGYDRCGKLLVASNDAEIERVRALERQGLANDVEGMCWLSRRETLALEPELNAVASLLSAATGVFDSHGFMIALRGEIEDHGGDIALETGFEGAQEISGGFRVSAVGGGEAVSITTKGLILSGGLEAQDLATKVEGLPSGRIPKRHLGKGCYFSLLGPSPFKRLIYPPPIPGALGTHYTRDLAGRGRFGPDLEYVDEIDYYLDPRRSESFYHAIRRYWPGLQDGRLTPDYVGIRPKIHGPGEPQPDFLIETASDHGMEGLITMFGIESPGLTSSLAIGGLCAVALGYEDSYQA